MSQAPRLARLFTPAYAARINAQILYPAISQVVKPNELSSALMRPLQTSVYEPNQTPAYLAATLSYGIMKGQTFPTFSLDAAEVCVAVTAGHPFLDGNKRTGTSLLVHLSCCSIIFSDSLLPRK